MIRVGFIGSGNMAMAIISGMVQNRLGVRIMPYDIHQANYSKLSQMGIVTCDSAKEAVSQSAYVVLAVKPQNFQEALQDIKPFVEQSTVFVSIAAGITEEFISNSLGFDAKVVLVMPNTSLLIGKGTTAIAPGKTVDEPSLMFVKNIFSLNGHVEIISKEQMNSVIALNGSSPAFIYLFAKSFIDYALQHGFEENVAKQLFCSSLCGAAGMILQSGESIDSLIQQVSSPGGTTLAGLDVLKKSHFEQIIQQACEQCKKRAEELSR